MILNQKERTVDTNIDQSQVFKIKTTAQAFKILSSNLYSNKIRAIVRELSCNAVDAHKAAHNSEPFKVHLPNDLEPYFSVKDFGIGLSQDEVFELYTSYFESTKSQSNDFIGALGLGSKSPFSYVDSFTIESIYNGEKKDYSAYISETGVPTISLLNTSKIDAHNGLEVKIPVEENDYRKFTREAEIIYYAFPQNPIIHGQRDYEDYKEYEEKNNLIIAKGNGWKILKSMPHNIESGCYACQGFINYPIKYDIIENNAKTYEDKNKIQFVLYNNIIIDFPLGSLDIAASREEISYDAKTIKTIYDRIFEIYDEMSAEFQAQIDKLSLYDAIEYFRTNISYSIHNSNRLKLIHKATNKPVDDDQYFEISAPIIMYTAKDYDNAPYGIRLSQKKFDAKEKYKIYPCKKNNIFLLEDETLSDLKFREKIRALLYGNDNYHLPCNIFIAQPVDANYFADNIGNPEIVKLSEIKIPEVPVEKRQAKPRQTEENFKLFNSDYFSITFYDLQEDGSDKYYLVNHGDEISWENGLSSIYPGKDHSISAYVVKHFMEYMVKFKIIDNFNDIYVVKNKETNYKRFQEATNLKRYDLTVEDRINKYIDAHEKKFETLFYLSKQIANINQYDLLNEFNNSKRRGKNIFNEYFWDKITPNSELKKAYLLMGNNKLSELISDFGRFIESDCMPKSTRAKFSKIDAKIQVSLGFDKFALLKWIDFSSYHDDLKDRLIASANYINSIQEV